MPMQVISSNPTPGRCTSLQSLLTRIISFTAVGHGLLTAQEPVRYECHEIANSDESGVEHQSIN